VNNQTTLSDGKITNHDEITVILIEPTDGTPALVRVHWPLRPHNSCRQPLPCCGGGDRTHHR
jgi:hypothetical protein